MADRAIAMVLCVEEAHVAAAGLAVWSRLDGHPGTGVFGGSPGLARSARPRQPHPDHRPVRCQQCSQHCVESVVLHAAPAGLGVGRGAILVAFDPRSDCGVGAIRADGELADGSVPAVGELRRSA